MIFLRFSGKQHEASTQSVSHVPLLSCMTHAPRSPHAYLRSQEKRKKNTPVLQANLFQVKLQLLHHKIMNVVNTVK